MIVVRCSLSWFPYLHRYKFSQFLVFYTDPYLNAFRQIVPPVLGAIDISPIIGLFALNFLEKFILYYLL